MKIINYATYVDDLDLVALIRPTHRRYTAQLTAASKLIAGGPFSDGTGALFIYEVASLEEAHAIVADDPNPPAAPSHPQNPEPGTSSRPSRWPNNDPKPRPSRPLPSPKEHPCPSIHSAARSKATAVPKS